MSWHVEAHVWEAYAAGGLDVVAEASVESHVSGCPQCRSSARSSVTPAETTAVWDAVRTTIAEPPLPAPLRLLRRLGVPAQDLVAVSAADSLLVTWATAVGFAVLSACLVGLLGLDPVDQDAAFLALSPLVPVLAVVAAYDALDPLREVALATAYSKLRLALLRATAALGVAVPATLAIGYVVPHLHDVALVWMAPALGLTTGVLALLTWVKAPWPERSSEAPGLVWWSCSGTAGTSSCSPPRPPSSRSSASPSSASRCCSCAPPPSPCRETAVTTTAMLEGAWKTFGATTAIRETTVDLRPGVIGLLGPNGAGKTTLLRLLSTSLPPSGGRIIVTGLDVTGSHANRVEARRRIGYCPQEVVYPRGMTAASFLDYIAVLKEWKDSAARAAEVHRVLDLVHLGDRGAMKVSKLSGGQRRRLAIAQALIGQPPLLILDEPTTGLDPNNARPCEAFSPASRGPC